jgi:hypothetical protein
VSRNGPPTGVPPRCFRRPTLRHGRGAHVPEHSSEDALTVTVRASSVSATFQARSGSCQDPWRPLWQRWADRGIRPPGSAYRGFAGDVLGFGPAHPAQRPAPQGRCGMGRLLIRSKNAAAALAGRSRPGAKFTGDLITARARPGPGQSRGGDVPAGRGTWRASSSQSSSGRGSWPVVRRMASVTPSMASC